MREQWGRREDMVKEKTLIRIRRTSIGENKRTLERTRGHFGVPLYQDIG